MIFEPLDFMYRMYGMPRAQGCAGAAVVRLAALVPKPRVNLTRFHGVFAPKAAIKSNQGAIKGSEPNGTYLTTNPLMRCKKGWPQ